MKRKGFSVEEICKKRKLRISVSLDEDVLERIDVLAQESNRSRSNMINYILKRCIHNAWVEK